MSEIFIIYVNYPYYACRLFGYIINHGYMNITYPSYSCDVSDFGRTHFGHYTKSLTQQRKQWISVELNRWRSERIHCYF